MKGKRWARLSTALLGVLAVLMIASCFCMHFNKYPVPYYDEGQVGIACYTYTSGVPYPWHPVSCDSQVGK